MNAPTHTSWGAEALWQQLSPLLPELSIEVVERIVSTNTALLERARAGLANAEEVSAAQVRRSVESRAFGRRSADFQPCLLVAEHQTGGRGRLGRVWQAAAGASLTFSLALPMAPADWSGLSLAVGVALADALEPAAAEPPRLALKWPNDLWLREPDGTAGRKLGGVLIETVAGPDRRLAVIGVGLNVLPLAVTDASTGYASLSELEPSITAPAALARIARPLVETLLQFEREGFAAFAERFARRDLLAGQPVRTTLADAAEGTACGVAADGALRLRLPDGSERRIASGEVSVRPDAPRGGEA